MLKGMYSALFVTWYTRSSRPFAGQRLRGCIGTFEPQPIREGLAKYSLISAFNDSRFPPIEERELSSLECGLVMPFTRLLFGLTTARSNN